MVKTQSRERSRICFVSMNSYSPLWCIILPLPQYYVSSTLGYTASNVSRLYIYFNISLPSPTPPPMRGDQINTKILRCVNCQSILRLICQSLLLWNNPSLHCEYVSLSLVSKKQTRSQTGSTGGAARHRGFWEEKRWSQESCQPVRMYRE